jgi:hypothetical protein
VELIVLNVGLQAGIIDTRLFSMFVVHAVILTVIVVLPHHIAEDARANKAREGQATNRIYQVS